MKIIGSKNLLWYIKFTKTIAIKNTYIYLEREREREREREMIK